MTEHLCIACQVPWGDPKHKATMRRELGSIWNGKPGQLVPHRQWTRENLPTSAANFIVAGDDGFVRSWNRTDQLGHAGAIEWKSYGRALDVPTRKVFDCLGQPGRFSGWVAVTLHGGNVPSALRHYPTQCLCGLPEAPVVAERIDIAWQQPGGRVQTKEGVTVDLLCAGILRFVGWMEAV